MYVGMFCVQKIVLECHICIQSIRFSTEKLVHVIEKDRNLLRYVILI
jgi:hypothetical protein